MACEELGGEGPLGLNYQAIHCSLQGDPILQAVLVVGILGWVIALIHLLGHTAGNYLSPTLGKICEKLHLSYNVAGVTFLAFGNGSPDVFSSITSFLGGDDAPLIGINALLGGSMFVCTVVVGSIAIICPCNLSGKVFLRDIGFHMLAVSAVAIIAAQRSLTMHVAIALFILYCLYVATVLGTAWYDQRTASRLSAIKSALAVSTTLVDGAAPIPDAALGKALQTAFWHQPPATNPSSSSSAASAAASTAKAAKTASSAASTAAVASAAGPGGYTFLILNEHGEDRTDAEDATITLSGGLISAAFSGKIIEDYCVLPAAGATPKRGLKGTTGTSSSPQPSSGASSWANMRVGRDGDTSSRQRQHKFLPLPLGLDAILGVVVGGAGVGESAHLRDSLLPYADKEEEEAEDEGGGGCDNDPSHEVEMETFGTAGGGSGGGSGGGGGSSETWRGPARGKPSAAGTVLTALYWQQWLLHRRVRRELLSWEVWREAPLHHKLLALLEAPFSLMRDASIPTLQPEAWSKSYAVAHPIAAPLVLLVATGSWSARVGSLSAPIFVCLVGLAPALAVYLLTLNSRPPKGGVVALLWVLGAFLMCVAWIYILAGELVVCLEALGRMLSVPSAYLGLTVLAWGNSIGDFFSNTSLARRGLGEMALAGCYGGPVFNMLVGLSLSIGYACLQTAPAPFVVQVDSSCIVSIVFLFIALGSTTAIVSMRGFRLERGTGYLLVALYCLYSVVQALMALTNRE